MQFYTVRDLRTQPKQIWKKLAEVHELIITNNGKPSALMLDIGDDNMEEVLALIRQTMAMRATHKIRLSSLLNDRDNISDEEIEAEIAAVRQARAK